MLTYFFDKFTDRLLPSGDLLQHFFTVIFSKLDKGEMWDDDFELNTILQVKLLHPMKYSAYYLRKGLGILLSGSSHRATCYTWHSYYCLV